MAISKISNTNAIDTGAVNQNAIATGVAGTGPAFSAATGYALSVSNATVTAATGFGTPTFDTASAFNTTNGRFTPQVAGYYQLNSQADFGSSGVGAASVIQALILKNGSSIASGGYATSGGSFSSCCATQVVYLNGSTDYAQAGIYQNSGGTTGNVRSIFSGALIRAA